MEDQSIKQSIITEGSKNENEHLRLNFVKFLFFAVQHLQRSVARLQQAMVKTVR